MPKQTIFLIVRDYVEYSDGGQSYLYEKISHTLEEAKAWAQMTLDSENADNEIETEERLVWEYAEFDNFHTATDPQSGDEFKIYQREIGE